MPSQRLFLVPVQGAFAHSFSLWTANDHKIWRPNSWQALHFGRPCWTFHLLKSDSALPQCKRADLASKLRTSREKVFPFFGVLNLKTSNFSKSLLEFQPVFQSNARVRPLRRITWRFCHRRRCKRFLANLTLFNVCVILITFVLCNLRPNLRYIRNLKSSNVPAVDPVT